MGPKFQTGAQGGEQPPIATVAGRVACSWPIMVADFAFLKSRTTRTPKTTIPPPSMLHLRGGRAAISREACPDLAGFWGRRGRRLPHGHAPSLRRRLPLPAARRLDDIIFANLCDPKIQANCRANGDDPAE